MRGTIGSREVTLNLRDRLVVRENKLAERAARGLPIGMSVAILRTPSVWRKAAKLLARVRWSAPATPRAGQF